MSFTTEEIFKLIFKNKKSIHLEYFKKIPDNFANKNLDEKWTELKKIREICNSSIEEKRALKEIGSSLEADLTIELSKEFYNKYNNIDFAELTISSTVNLIPSNNDEIKVITKKAEGEKCQICWKIIKAPCARCAN